MSLPQTLNSLVGVCCNINFTNRRPPSFCFHILEEIRPEGVLLRRVLRRAVSAEFAALQPKGENWEEGGHTEGGHTEVLDPYVSFYPWHALENLTSAEGWRHECTK